MPRVSLGLSLLSELALTGPRLQKRFYRQRAHANPLSIHHLE